MSFFSNPDVILASTSTTLVALFFVLSIAQLPLEPNFPSFMDILSLLQSFLVAPAEHELLVL